MDRWIDETYYIVVISIGNAAVADNDDDEEGSGGSGGFESNGADYVLEKPMKVRINSIVISYMFITLIYAYYYNDEGEYEMYHFDCHIIHVYHAYQRLLL